MEDSKWRRTNVYDVAIQVLGVIVIGGFAYYVVTDSSDSDTKRLVLGLLWAFLLVMQARTLLVVMRKYRNGEEIKTGFFANVRETKPGNDRK